MGSILKHYKLYGDLSFNERPSVTIGCFDGLHVGHVKLIEECRSISIKTVLITFDTGPTQYLLNKNTDFYITTEAQKVKIATKDLRVNAVMVLDFEKNHKIHYSEFLDSIKNSINPSAIVVGSDFKYGHNREGGIRELDLFCTQNNISLKVIDYARIDNQQVSSTAIRSKIREGDIEQANVMLGRGLSICGEVVKGEKRGLKTANIDFSEEYIRPKFGVYIVEMILNNQRYKGLANFGIKPTFNESNGKPSLEVHVPSVDLGDIYGSFVEVVFIKYIRGEIAFDSIDDLRRQIAKDIMKLNES